MATAPNRPPGRSVKNLGMIWRFVSRYRPQVAGAAAALLVAAAATSGVPYAFKLIIDKGFAQGGSTSDIARWFEYLLMLVGMMATAYAWRHLGYERHIRRVAEIEHCIALRNGTIRRA